MIESGCREGACEIIIGSKNAAGIVIFPAHDFFKNTSDSI